MIYITDLHWFPASVKAKAENQVCAVGSSDGRFYVINKAGRVEKMVEAHSGALLALKWNYEGSALLTAGEDGHVKIWSRSGMLRNVLIQTGNAVYSSCWSPENDQIILTSGCNIIIKPIQPSSKPNQWKAHDGIILKVDWNLANGLICSAGEDRKYKLWDSFGRLLFSSSPHDHPITCVSWNSSGEMFAVGGFNLLRICDRLGWSYALYDSDCGSISSIAWTVYSLNLARWHSISMCRWKRICSIR